MHPQNPNGGRRVEERRICPGGTRAQEAIDSENDIRSLEIKGVAHDACRIGHDRDYRGAILRYQDLMMRNGISSRAIELGNSDEGGYVLTVRAHRR